MIDDDEDDDGVACTGPCLVQTGFFSNPGSLSLVSSHRINSGLHLTPDTFLPQNRDSSPCLKDCLAFSARLTETHLSGSGVSVREVCLMFQRSRSHKEARERGGQGQGSEAFRVLSGGVGSGWFGAPGNLGVGARRPIVGVDARVSAHSHRPPFVLLLPSNARYPASSSALPANANIDVRSAPWSRPKSSFLFSLLPFNKGEGRCLRAPQEHHRALGRKRPSLRPAAREKKRRPARTMRVTWSNRRIKAHGTMSACPGGVVSPPTREGPPRDLLPPELHPLPFLRGANPGWSSGSLTAAALFGARANAGNAGRERGLSLGHPVISAVTHSALSARRPAVGRPPPPNYTSKQNEKSRSGRTGREKEQAHEGSLAFHSSVRLSSQTCYERPDTS
ncbi:hypothetical protein AAFF_G00208810 [Aldrovandia affinis]|uniref:Uncharacterized protein n=1 Tax=Aldrovandia affinis TaxID=143900 RepID=A0AAD7W5G4_9TELE|nr:hypothetical protein AAFF_G00208810 [Aldrovandia affinis]